MEMVKAQRERWQVVTSRSRTLWNLCLNSVGFRFGFDEEAHSPNFCDLNEFILRL